MIDEKTRRIAHYYTMHSNNSFVIFGFCIPKTTPEIEMSIPMVLIQPLKILLIANSDLSMRKLDDHPLPTFHFVSPPFS